MSNYNKATNFSVKDTLTSGDPDKVVSGAEIDNEFDAISSAVGSKADKVAAATTDNFAALDSNGNLKDSSFSAGNSSGQVAVNNGVLNTDLNASKLNGEDASFYTDYLNLTNKPSISFGDVQITGYVNDFDGKADFTAPDGSFLVGEYSYHSSDYEDRRFRFRYRSINISGF